MRCTQPPEAPMRLPAFRNQLVEPTYLYLMYYVVDCDTVYILCVSRIRQNSIFRFANLISSSSDLSSTFPFLSVLQPSHRFLDPPVSPAFFRFIALPRFHKLHKLPTSRSPSSTTMSNATKKDSSAAPVAQRPQEYGEIPVHAILSRCANVVRQTDPTLAVVLPIPLPSVPEILALIVPYLEEVQNADGGPTLAVTKSESPTLQRAHLMGMGMKPVPAAKPAPAQVQKELGNEDTENEAAARGLPILTEDKAPTTDLSPQGLTHEQRARLRDIAAKMD